MTHDNTQRSASLHVFPQSRHCPLTDEIIRGGRRHTFRAASRVFPFPHGASDLATFTTRGDRPQGCSPSLSKNVGSVSVSGQHFHGAPRYPGMRIHYRHSTGSVQKTNLVVAGWSRGELQEVLRSDCGSQAFKSECCRQIPGTSLAHV